MAPISLGDDLDIDFISGGVALTCNSKDLGEPSQNLAYRAAELFLQEFKLERGVRIHLEKKVPVGAGLGGGSSNAAAVLLGLRELSGLNIADNKLAELAAKLGSDVPFFIYRQSAIIKGRGEIVEPCTLPHAWHGLLVHPGFGIATPWAYQTYSKNPAHGKEGKKIYPKARLRNDLEPVVFGKYLWLPTVKTWFQKQPEVFDALMSGSGSAMFALVEDENKVADLRARFRNEFGAELFTAPFYIVTGQTK